MSILIDGNTRVITQGITGKTGAFHTRLCRDYANGKACFVAGVNPNKAGEDFVASRFSARSRKRSSAPARRYRSSMCRRLLPRAPSMRPWTRSSTS